VESASYLDRVNQILSEKQQNSKDILVSTGHFSNFAKVSCTGSEAMHRVQPIAIQIQSK
jgi:hypothetical protein